MLWNGKVLGRSCPHGAPAARLSDRYRDLCVYMFRCAPCVKRLGQMSPASSRGSRVRSMRSLRILSTSMRDLVAISHSVGCFGSSCSSALEIRGGASLERCCRCGCCCRCCLPAYVNTFVSVHHPTAHPCFVVRRSTRGVGCHSSFRWSHTMVVNGNRLDFTGVLYSRGKANPKV